MERVKCLKRGQEYERRECHTGAQSICVNFFPLVGRLIKKLYDRIKMETDIYIYIYIDSV